MLISKIRLLGLVAAVSGVIPGSFAQDKPAETATVEIRNAVEGEREIIRLVEQGTVVKKGDLLCELDSANLRERRIVELIATKRAEADYWNAMKTREVAEITLNEQVQAVVPSEIAIAEGDLKIAEGERVIAMAKLTAQKTEADAVKKVKSYKHDPIVHKVKLQELELEVTKAEVAIKKAKSRLENLIKFQHPRRLKKFAAGVEKAKSDELAKQQVHELHKNRLEKLTAELEQCQIKAPAAGVVVYAKPRASSRPETAGVIEQGAKVRQYQLLMTIEPSRAARDS
jgi:multidrug efflux pump subunit AcrA (membrane-fusion protein)